MKPASFISDSSSLILLAKAELLGLLCQNAHLYITPAIRAEIIFDSPDSRVIRALIFTGEIAVRNPEDELRPSSLDLGEKTAISLFNCMRVDYLLIDDRKAALYCRRHAIPYINALLVPCYLRGCGAMDGETMREKIGVLTGIGRYAQWIKDYVSGVDHVFS
ncbi:MAG: hypothetical protein ACMUIS_06535 [bacterium]